METGARSAQSNSGRPDTPDVSPNSSNHDSVAGLPGLPRPGWATAFPSGFRRCLDFGMRRLAVGGSSLPGALFDAILCRDHGTEAGQGAPQRAVRVDRRTLYQIKNILILVFRSDLRT
jgi:hypothetical protein